MAEKVVIGVSVDTSEAIKNVNKFSGELGKLKKELEQEKAELAKVRKEFKALNTPVDELTKSQKKLRAELNKQGKSLDDVSKSYAKQQGKVKALNKNYNEAEGSVSGLSKGTGRLKGAITDGLKSFTLLAGGIGIVIGVAKELATQFIELNKQITDTATRAAFFFDLTSEGARELSLQATIIGKQFDQDVNSVLDVANTLSKEFGISGKEALDLISKGFETGGRFSDDFLNQLKEYPSQLAQVGLSADQTVALLNQSIKDGVFSDKGLDSIKEAGIRLREATNATQTALDNVGLGDLPKRIQEGTITSFEAIQEVSGKLKELGNTGADTGTLIADVFGGAGEDAGFKFLTSLEDVNLELNDLDSSLTKTETAQNRLTEVWTKFLTSDDDGGEFFSVVLDFFADLVEGMDYFAGVYKDTIDPVFESLFDSLFAIIEPFKNVLEQLGFFSDEAGESSVFLKLFKVGVESAITPLQAIAKTITLVIRAITFAIIKIREGIADLVADVPFVGDLLGNTIGVTADQVKAAEDKLETAFDSLISLPKDKFNAVKDIFVEGQKEINDALEGIGGDLGSANGGEGAEPESDADPKAVENEEKQQAAIQRSIELLQKKSEAVQIAFANEQEVAAKAAELRESGASADEINLELQKLRAVQAKEGKILALEDERLIALEQEGLKQSQIDIINQEFRDLRLLAEADYQAQLTEISLTEEEKRLENQAKAQKESDKLAEDNIKKKEKIAEDAANQLSGVVSGFLTSQENALDGFAQGTAKIALDALNKQAPALIAGIFGQSLAKLGPVGGTVASVAAIAAFKGLISSASASFEDGGQLPKYATGGRLQGRSHAQGGIPLFRNGAQIAEVEGGEFIINKQATSQNLRLLESINAGEFTPNSPTVSSAQNTATATYESIISNREKDPLTAIVSEQEVTRSQKRISKFERTSTLR